MKVVAELVWEDGVPPVTDQVYEVGDGENPLVVTVQVTFWPVLAELGDGVQDVIAAEDGGLMVMVFHPPEVQLSLSFDSVTVPFQSAQM